MDRELSSAVAVLEALLQRSGVEATRTRALDVGLLPRPLPVCRWFRPVLREASGLTEDVCRTLGSVAARLHWRQNPSYAGASFLDGYAYCELVGPQGHLQDERKSLGLLLLGPETEYPAHAHPARETYLILSGNAEWQVGAGGWTARAAGDVIQHPAGVPHAMRTGGLPLLAAYQWEDHLDVPARLTSA